MRLLRRTALLAAGLLLGCGGIPTEPTASEAKVASGGALVLKSAEGVWGGDVLAGKDGATWVAAALHVENQLGMWKIDSDRRATAPPLLGETGYHPDGVAAWDESSVAVAVEGSRRLQLWRVQEDQLVKEADFPTVFAARDVVVADLDGDGHRDVVLAPYAGEMLAVMWGQGGFEFSEVQMLRGGASGWHPVAVDFDGDGRLDLLWAELDTGVVRLARNEGGRSFTVSQIHKVKGFTARQLAVGDVDRDGRLDIAIAVEIGDAEVLLTQADGSFVTRTIKPRALGHIGVAVDKDGTVSLSDEGEVTLFRLEGEGWARRRVPVASMPAPIALAHVDRDEHQDLMVYHSSGSGGVWVYFGPVWDRAEVLESLKP